ncbi:MAG: type II toxin-antitoxin system RelE/ParE family toxin [Luteolibacter sp.]
MKISASEQVSAWLCGLPPQTKQRVRLALRGLVKGEGDIKGLQGPLEGFNRLRIGGQRIIYRQVSGQEIRLEYANTRDVIYELYEHILENRKR